MLSSDLSKMSYLLEEMQQEIKIYKALIDVCYGYLSGDVLCTIPAGAILSKDKRLTVQQKIMTLDALKVIHKYGIHHNDFMRKIS
ncbi:hypothetical protein Glove_692g7 [Diversispora epigaea]|uniref:Uncharacterized protein n=1 Tax=Diversispora epigaea TaxID=1348612 RepID=A0A397G253_9GLOM|nr:hypothetical protein Glove_692g7 [Diversispora epigaea]